MNESNIKEFSSLVAGLFSIKGKPMPPNTVAIWGQFLGEYTIEQMRSAFTTAMKDTSEEWPRADKIAELIDGNPVEEAEAQWEKIDRYYIQYFEGYRKIENEVSERARVALSRVGGLKRLYDAKNNEVPFMRKDFLEAYKNYAKRETFAMISESIAGKQIAEKLKLGRQNE